MKVGQIIRLGVDSSGARIYGKIIFVHPHKRFVTVERDAPYGAKIREARYIGIRRGNRQPSGRWAKR